MVHPLLFDMSVHHFDLLRFITGLEAVSVRGDAWNPPWSKNSGDTSVTLSFTLENGARFVYAASWCAQGDFADWNGNWLVDGDLGSLRYRDEVLTLNHVSPRYEVEDSQVVRQNGPPLLNQAYVLADFMAAREENRLPRTNIFDNLKSFAMVSAAVEAVNSGQVTPIASLDELMTYAGHQS
jgi:predicted dehydrogenase